MPESICLTSLKQAEVGEREGFEAWDLKTHLYNHAAQKARLY